MSGESSVSVVMSVFDNAGYVKRTIDSVLAQEKIDFEFIIVNDGAEQDVIELLSTMTDPRIKIVTQDNQGLTKALIHGCDLASHDYIARIDAGDLMLSNRLKLQTECLDKHPSVGMVSSWVKIFTTEGYHLYDICHSTTELKQGLAAIEAQKFKSPFHASMMFRKLSYQQVGGYRSEFYFTQDCDLWARMLCVSDIVNLDEYLTHGIFSATGISGLYAQYQKQLVNLVAHTNLLRRDELNDQTIVDEAALLRPRGEKPAPTPDQRFSAEYFIASVLSTAKSPYASSYWQRALSIKPFSLKARLRWLASLRHSGKDKVSG